MHMIKAQLRSVYRTDGLARSTVFEASFRDIAAVVIPEIRRLGRPIRWWRPRCWATRNPRCPRQDRGKSPDW